MNLSEKDLHWLNIIQECRTSGKSDYQWLREHNIASATFYYHVKQLRKKACEIPEHNQLCQVETQEVVPLFIKDAVTENPQQINDSTAVSTAIRFNIYKWYYN